MPQVIRHMRSRFERNPPQRYREVVTLFYMEDKSCEQTAAALGIPVGTVKALLHRARRRIIELAHPQDRGD